MEKTRVFLSWKLTYLIHINQVKFDLKSESNTAQAFALRGCRRLKDRSKSTPFARDAMIEDDDFMKWLYRVGGENGFGIEGAKF